MIGIENRGLLAAANQRPNAPKAEPSALEKRANEIMQQIMKENAAEWRSVFLSLGKIPSAEAKHLKDICLSVAAFEQSEKGKEKRLRKNVKHYQGADALPYTFRIKRSFDNKNINVSITYPGKEGLIGEGGFKTVKKGYKIPIPVENTQVAAKNGKPCTAYKIQDSIISRSKGGEEGKRKILEGLELRKLLNTLMDEEKQLLYTEVPSIMLYQSKNNTERLEMMQRWYNGDLAAAIEKGVIPVKNSGSKKEILANIITKLDILIPVAKACGILHKNGYAHRDVKPANILAKMSRNLKAHGVLNDFDLIEKFGLSTNAWNYVYWDALGRQGIVTPSTDIYGMAYSLGECIFPRLWQRLGAVNRIDNPDAVFKRELDIKAEEFFKKFGIAIQTKEIPFDPNIPGNYADELLKQVPKHNLSSKQLLEIAQFIIEIGSSYGLWVGVVHQINQSYESFAAVRNNPALWQKLHSQDMSLRKEAIQEVIQIQKDKGLLSADEFEGLLIKCKNKIKEGSDSIAKTYFEKEFPLGKEVKGQIVSAVKGGYSIWIHGAEAFLPQKAINAIPGFNPDQFINKELSFNVTNHNYVYNNIVVEPVVNRLQLGFRIASNDTFAKQQELVSKLADPIDHIDGLNIGEVAIVIRSGPPAYYEYVKIIARDPKTRQLTATNGKETVMKDIKGFYKLKRVAVPR